MPDEPMTWEGLCPLGEECPWPSDPDAHIPWCGHGLIGHHHHWPKRSQGGKRIVAFLCPECHRKVDERAYGNAVLDVHGVGKVYRIWRTKDNSTVLERVIEAADKDTDTSQEVIAPPPDEPREALTTEPGLIDTQEGTDCKPALPAVKVSLENVPDEQLAALFAEADKQQANAFLLKCQIIQAYRDRHIQAWGESWLEQAYELFHVSRRTLFAYANIAEISATSDTYLVEAIAPLTDSRSLMQHIGRKALADGRVALEAAVAHLAEYGEPPTVAALEHRLGQEGEVPALQLYQCPKCQHEGPLADFRKGKP